MDVTLPSYLCSQHGREDDIELSSYRSNWTRHKFFATQPLRKTVHMHMGGQKCWAAESCPHECVPTSVG